MSNMQAYNFTTGKYEDVKVSTKFTSLDNTVTLGADSTFANIGITSFNPVEDVLFVVKNTTVINQGTGTDEYVLDGGNLRIENPNGLWLNGTKFYFRVLKNVDRSELPSYDPSLFQDAAITKAKLALELQNELDEVVSSRTGQDSTVYANLKARLDGEYSKVKLFLDDIAVNIKKFGGKGDGITDNTAAINAAIAYCKQNGIGIILFPSGLYYVASNITVDAQISFVGNGYTSCIRCDGTITFSVDGITLKDLELVSTGSNTLLYLTGRYEIHNVWFHAAGNAGILLKTYGATLCGISHCLFTQVTIQGTATGIWFVGDDTTGTMNTDVSFCKFNLLNVAIHCEGSANGSNYVNACGYRLISNMMISCSTGLYAKNCDYVTFENSMIDYGVTPIYIENANNIKIRDNYVFSTHTDPTKLIAIEKTLSHSTLYCEISGNYISDGTYNASTQISNGQQTYGIYIHSDTYKLDQVSIHDNSFIMLSYAIYLCTSNGGTITKPTISNNKCTSTVYYIMLNDTGVQNAIVSTNNTYDSSSVSYYLINNGTGTSQNSIAMQTFSVTVPASTSTKVQSTGIPVGNIIGGYFTYTDAVYYLNPILTFDGSGSIYIRCTSTNASAQTLTVNVAYRI